MTPPGKASPPRPGGTRARAPEPIPLPNPVPAPEVASPDAGPPDFALAMRGRKVMVLSHRKTSADSIAAIDYRPADVTRPGSLVTALVGVDTLVIRLGFRNSPVE